MPPPAQTLVKFSPLIMILSIFQEFTEVISPVVAKQKSPVPSCVNGREIDIGLSHGVKLTPVTVTADEAVKPPSTVVAVIVTLPTSTLVTTPPEFTVAILLLPELQETFLLVALSGDTVAVNEMPSPSGIETIPGSTVTPVTATVLLLTVTRADAVKPPSTVVAVIVAVPFAAAVTTPPEFILATLLLLVFQVTSLLLALDGITVAVNVPVLPGDKDKVAGLSVTPVTAVTVPGAGSVPATNTPSAYNGILPVTVRASEVRPWWL